MPGKTPAKTYAMNAYPTQVAVRSETDGARAYEVHLPYCPCPDFINRKGRLDNIDGVPVITICKHLVQAMELVGGWHTAAKAPEIHPDVLQAVALELLTADGNMTRAYAHSCLSEVGVRGAKFSLFAGNQRSGVVTCDNRLGRYTVIFT